RLSGVQADSLEAHLLDCRHCLARVPLLKAEDEVVSAMRVREAIEDPGPELLEHLLRWARDLQPAPARSANGASLRGCDPNETLPRLPARPRPEDGGAAA